MTETEVTGEVQGLDITLVESNCLTIDATLLSLGDTSSCGDNRSNFGFELLFYPDVLTGVIFIAGKGRWATSYREAFFGSNGTKFLAFFNSASGVYGSITSTTDLVAGAWNHIVGNFNNGEVTVSINGTEEVLTVSSSVASVYHNANAQLTVGGASDGGYKAQGRIAYFKYMNAEYNFAEGDGTTNYNTGTANIDLVMTGATLPDCWANTQDERFYNINKDVDVYEDGSGNKLFVPAGATVVEAGWTYVSTNEAGAWHNLTEAKMKLRLDATLQDICSGLTTNIFYGAGTDITVSGAGSTAVNQNYMVSGTYGGRTRWESEDGLYEIVWYVAYWVIRLVGSTQYYYADEDISDPADAVTWHITGSGVAPVPTDVSHGFDALAFHPSDLVGFDYEVQHKIFYMADEYKFFYFLWYSVAKTEAEISKIVKCMSKKVTGDYILLTDENGVIFMSDATEILTEE